MPSLATLTPAIRRILTDPTTDLGSVSAKRVRKQLVSQPELGISDAYVQEHKAEIDQLITDIFESVSAAVGGVTAAPSPPSSSQPAKVKRKRDDNGHSNDYDDEDTSDHATPPAKKKPKNKSRGLTDEEIARQLSAELNANPTRRGNGPSASRRTKAPSRSPKKVKKSRDTIDDDSDAGSSAGGSDDDRPKKSKKKSGGGGGGGGGGGKGGFQKELLLSQELHDVLHEHKLSRPQVVKRLWEYIREHQLQNPSNRKQILCDDKLQAVFKVAAVDMFTMNKLLKVHLTDPANA